MLFSRFSITVLVAFLQLLPAAGAAQLLKRTAVTSYTIENGLLQNSVASMVVDHFGFAWFSTGAGIQRFDGRHFEVVNGRRTNGGFLTAAHLNLLKNGEIWISDAAGLSAINPATNRQRTIYSQPPLLQHFYRYGGEDESTVWYLAYRKGFLQFDKKTGRLQEQVPFTSWPDSINQRFFCRQMGVDKMAIRFYKALAVFNMREKKMISFHHTPEPVTGFLPLNDTALLYTMRGGYYRLNTVTGKERFLGKAAGAAEGSTFELSLTKNGELLSAYNQTICELDTATFALKARWAAFNQNNLLNSGYITHTLLDRFNRLWLLTNSDGVKKLSLGNRPFAYYGTARREHNFIRSIHYNAASGQLLAGTFGSGLLLFDTLGQVLQHVPQIGTSTTVVSILPLQNDRFLMLTMGDEGLSVFNAKTGATTLLPFLPSNAGRHHASYYARLWQLSKNRFLMADHNLFQLSLEGKGVRAAVVRPPIDYHYNFCILNNGTYCLATDKGLQFTDTAFRTLYSAPFRQAIFPRCLSQDQNGFLWIGTETGLYKLDRHGTVLKKYTLADGLTDEGIYAIEPAPGGIYFSHNKGLSFLSAKGHFTHYTRHAGLQENEFNTKASFRSPEGQLFFGGINGITAFHPQRLALESGAAPVAITTLEVADKPWRDTAVWNIAALSLKHNEARVAFRVGVPAGADNTGYVYEYKLEGLEPNWLSTSGADFIRYVLPPGTYTFKVRLGNGGGNSNAEKHLRITVAAPYWQTTWFRVGAGLLIVGLIAFSIHRYNRTRYRKRLAQLEFEHKLQLERERISRDLHDNLGAYATAIADGVDRVVKNGPDDARLRGLKEAAAEIMTNLRDTIWALNKKQISVLTFTDRIKSYLQKMREAYPSIQIVMEENVDTAAAMSPELALNVLRIVQEAFHNAIRHSGGNRILITLNAGDQLYICVSDNGQGLPPVLPTSGYGLHNMKLRAKEANLHLQVRSGEGEGTQVEVVSPLQ